MNRRMLFGVLMSVAGILGAATFVANANAAPAKQSDNTLKISPLRTELSVAAGKTTKVSVYISNVTKDTLTYKVINNDFVAGDEKGTPSLILDENSYAPSHSLKRFMKPISNIQVAPGATQQVDVTIEVPKTAKAGGYFGALRFVPITSSGSISVNLNASAASLILLTVPGDLQEELTVTDFEVQQDGQSATNFRSPDKLEVMLRAQNLGNVQVAPYGQINVKKGDKVVHKIEFNNTEPKSNVLPDSARRWNLPLQNVGKFGKYTVTGTLSYGTQNKSVEIEKSFWVVPTLYIIIGVALLIGLIALIVFIRLFLKSYKKKILKKAGK